MPGARVVPRRPPELRRAGPGHHRRRHRRGRPLAVPRRARPHLGRARATRSAAAAPGSAASASGAATASSAYLPNAPEALVAFLATASLGAVWASCPPEFGARSVIDRFGQLDPVVLLVTRGYRYGDKDIDRTAEVDDDRRRAPDRAGGRRRRHRLGRPARRGRPSLALRAGAVRPPALRAVLLGHDRAAQGDRPRPRRHPRRAPQGARPAPRPRAPATASSGSPPPAG